MTEALSALLVDLEAATGPSRELDAKIARAVGWRWDWGGVLGWEWVAPEGRMRGLPHFTESIDCAMTLVPPTHFYLLIFGCKADGYTCSLGGDELRGEGIIHYADPAVLKAHAKTEPLALCIAAVRARLAGQKE